MCIPTHTDTLAVQETRLQQIRLPTQCVKCSRKILFMVHPLQLADLCKSKAARPHPA